jgi:hypothetical protein
MENGFIVHAQAMNPFQGIKVKCIDLHCAMKMDTAAIGAPDNAEKVH